LGEQSRAALVVRLWRSGYPVSTEISELHLQSYVSGPPSGIKFNRMEDKLRFNWSTSTHALHLIRHSNILDNFWDFDNYLEDNRAPFLTNGAVVAALNGQQPR
jgi:hypothetical protein